MENQSKIPNHIGLILDGNRRWANERGLKTTDGHQRGSEVFKEMSLYIFSKGIKYISAYVFSSENWQRKTEEVDFLMRLFIKAVEMYLSEFHEKGIRIVFLGSRESLKPTVLKTLERTEEKTATNKNGTLAICFNYGGKQEIVEAYKRIAESGEEINESAIDKNVYSGKEVPELDLIVRTSGEKRLSGFMTWRAQYAELLFDDKLWPDINKNDVDGWLDEFALRQRRFGC